MHILLEIPIISGLSIEVYIILLVIAVPSFFFWRWLFKQYIKDSRRRKLATWFATLITPFIYAGVILLFLFGITYTPSRSFDKSTWLADKQERFQMGDDIIENELILGKDTNQVKQILGNPTWGDTTQTWTYDMGSGGGGLGFLLHYLHVKFDNKGRVTSVEHLKIED